MTNNEQSQLTLLLNTYTESREALRNLLKDSEDGLNQPVLDKIQETGKILDTTFAELIATRPSTMSDVYSKANAFVSEILSETEVTTYHREALLSLLEDLKSLL